jgi:hypothetical protein
VKKIKFNIVWILVVLLLVIVNQFSALAHYPPSPGRQECGLVVGDTFYSDYYSPPEGTPAVNGSCMWVKMSTTKCARENYYGTYYDLYPYQWVCNMPLDSNVYFLMFGVVVFGYFKLNRTKNSLKQPI